MKKKSWIDLRFEALQAAYFRGHTMTQFVRLELCNGHQIERSVCVICGRDVDIDIDPPANGIDIAGEAVALGCRD